MLPSASALACRRKERVQKAFSVDHHGPGDARLSHSAIGIYGELGDTVRHPELRAEARCVDAVGREEKDLPQLNSPFQTKPVSLIPTPRSYI